MIELLAGTAGILSVLLVIAGVYAVTYRRERDEARADCKIEVGAREILGNRVSVLRADIETLEKALETMRHGHDALAEEKEQLKRQIGRMEAEARAAKPKRGPGGKFIAKPKPATVTPLKCG